MPSPRCAHCGPVAPEHFRDAVHVQITPTPPQIERIAVALERIAAAMEHVGDAVHESAHDGTFIQTRSL